MRLRTLSIIFILIGCNDDMQLAQQGILGTARLQGDVFGVIGDSNADGRGDTIPVVAPNTLYNWNVTSFVEITTQSVAIDDNTKGSIWQQFATDYKAATGRKVLLVTGGSGGSEFYPNVDTNNWYTSGVLYAAWKTRMTNALNGRKATGIFIVLGVNDVRASHSIANITTGVNSLVSRLQTDFPGVPVLFVQVGRTETEINSQLLYQTRQLLKETCEANADFHMCGNAATFAVMSGGYNVDNLHYSQATNNSLGSMLARWFQNSAYSKWARSIISSYSIEISSARKTLINNFIASMGADFHDLNTFNLWKNESLFDVNSDWTFLGLTGAGGATVNVNSNVSTNGTTERIVIAYFNNYFVKGGAASNNYRFGVKLNTVGTAAGTAAIMFGTVNIAGTAAIRAAQGGGANPTNFMSNTLTQRNGTQADLVAGTLYTVARNGNTEEFYRNKTLDASGVQAFVASVNELMAVGALLTGSTSTYSFFYNGTYHYVFASPYTGFDYDNFYDAAEALVAGW